MVIVGCTDRKSLPVPSCLRAGSLPRKGDVATIAEHWVKSVKLEMRNGVTRPLRDLYQGEYWKVVLGLEGISDILVASAGLGMHSLDDRGIGYAATFTSGVTDTVVRWPSRKNDHPSVTWWKALQSPNGIGTPNWNRGLRDSRDKRPVLVAVSEAYQKALTDELIAVSATGVPVVIVSGSQQLHTLSGLPNIHHVKVGQKLRMLIGGSTPTVGIRFVRDVVERGMWKNIDDIQNHLENLELKYERLPRSKQLPRFERAPMASDEEVKKWIRQKIRQGCTGKLSKSRLLRILRDDENRSCEQKRFGRLFDEVVAAGVSIK